MKVTNKGLAQSVVWIALFLVAKAIYTITTGRASLGDYIFTAILVVTLIALAITCAIRAKQTKRK